MLDRVAVADEFVQTGIGAEGIFCARDVVGDGCREEGHGDAKGRVLLPCFAELRKSVESFEPANKEKAIEVVLFKESCDRVHAGFRRKFTVHANFRASFAGPVVDFEPVKFTYCAQRLVVVMTDETSKTIVNGDGGLPSSKTVCYSCSSRGINTTSWGTNMDDSNSHVLHNVSIDTIES